MIYRFLIVVAMLISMSGCFGNKNIDYTCDEPQRYQQVTLGKRIDSPEGLDPLNELMEMPIPEAEGAPVRPVGAPCIDLPPSVLSGN